MAKFDETRVCAKRKDGLSGGETGFDTAKAYAKQGETFSDDGREVELLRFVYSKPDIDQIRENPSRVLAAIDEYARTQKYLMNVGEDKGRIVTELIAKEKPQTMVSRLVHQELRERNREAEN